MAVASAQLSGLVLIHKHSISLENARISLEIIPIPSLSQANFPYIFLDETQILIYITAMAKWLDDGCTASALEHRFRPIKAAAKHGS